MPSTSVAVVLLPLLLLLSTFLISAQTEVVSSSAAASLLRDLQQLRESLQPNGAAAARCSSKQVTNGQQQPRRGILVVAGGQHQFRNAFVLLSLLVHPDVACRLPVELVYYGQQEYDAAAAAAMRQLAQQHGVSLRLIDGSAVPPSGSAGLNPHPAPGRLTGFKAKVHALVWVTSFDQVIMVDSDNSPLVDPTPLFDSEPFRALGSIFWPDFWTNQWMKPQLYSLLGLATPWEEDPGFRACEAGQIVIDRVKHCDVLEYLWLLDGHSNSGIPGAQLGAVGQCLWGDKDTYRIAFQLAGKGAEFYSVQHMPLQALSRPGGDGTTRLTHAGMVHRAPWGQGPLMWLHRTAAGKFYPHCAQSGGKPCRVWALTTPVDQQQLLASVRDPSAMELSTSQVDLEWRTQHCSSSAAESQAVADGQCSAEGGSGACDGTTTEPTTTLPCNLEAAAGALPIPVLRTKHLPAQVKRLLAAAQEAFLGAMQLR